jgi:hypothetical protein
MHANRAAQQKPTHASFHQALSEAAGEPRSPSDITLATLPLLCRTRCRDAAPWLLVAPGKRALLKRIRVLGDWRAPVRLIVASLTTTDSLRGMMMLDMA